MSMVPPPSFGSYLRHLRTSDCPGFPPGQPTRQRQRTSRTALAAAAGSSAGYVTKLEQGRADNPSPEVVDRLADALGAAPVERQHLHDLAAAPHVEHSEPTSARQTSITAVQKEAVEGLAPHVGGYVDEAWNVLYCNAEYTRLFRGIAEVGNVLTWFFLARESKAIMREWETEARLTVAWLRGLMARRPNSPVFTTILTELADYPEFVRMWQQQEVLLGRHTPYMRLHDLDHGTDVSLLAQVYPSPDPTQAMQLYLGIRTS